MFNSNCLLVDTRRWINNRACVNNLRQCIRTDSISLIFKLRSREWSFAGLGHMLQNRKQIGRRVATLFKFIFLYCRLYLQITLFCRYSVQYTSLFVLLLRRRNFFSVSTEFYWFLNIIYAILYLYQCFLFFRHFVNTDVNLFLFFSFSSVFRYWCFYLSKIATGILTTIFTINTSKC